MKFRLPLYITGLFIMALGIVFIVKADIGVSPISSIAVAISKIAPITLGNSTILFHIVCILVIIVVEQKITLRTLLILPLAIAFGYIIDFFMVLLPIYVETIILRLLFCLLGIMLTALGIIVCVTADLMLPAPDALLHTLSDKYSISFGTVKNLGDALWVCITIIIEKCYFNQITSISFGTVLAVILTGRFVGLFTKYFNRIKTN